MKPPKLMLPVVYIWDKFKLLSRLSFTVFLKEVFNLLIPEASLSAPEELIGKVVLNFNNSFLIFRKKLILATFKT